MDTTERVGRKKVYRKVLIVLGVWLLFIASIIGYGVYWLFFDWSRFKQELIAESTSPDGTYTVNAYVSDGGATTSYTVLGELMFNKENKKSMKIYGNIGRMQPILHGLMMILSK